MKNIGIWLDSDKAFIIDNNFIFEISSNVEHFNIHGGSGTRFKGGPQDVVQDSKYLERKKHQLKNYYMEIVNHLDNFDNLVIFGPAETYLGFARELESNYKPLFEKVINVVKADSMTENQLKAWVKNFYANF